jgi:hypothetical protein
MKPLGIAVGLNQSGVSMYVTEITKTEDAIWEAVKQAICEGWSPERFKQEASEAWEHELKEEIKGMKEILK